MQYFSQGTSMESRMVPLHYYYILDIIWSE